MKKWLDHEINYLRNNWPRMSDAEIAKALGRSEDAVKTFRYQRKIRIDPSEWTAEQDAHIAEHWNSIADAEIGRDIGKSAGEVYQRGVSLGLIRRRKPESKKTWTAEETDYLSENWGRVSIQQLCKTLGRTEASVITRKQKLGLGAFLDSGEYISLNQLLIAVVGGNSGSGYVQTSWVKNRGLPVRNKKVGEKRFRVVYLDEFWKWAEKNRSFIDFSKMEPLALGLEPEWVATQRKKDFTAFAIQRKDPWTSDDDSRLEMLLKQHKYGYAELSEMLLRSAGAIQRRCCDLGLKERPVKADNRSKEWTDADLQVVADGIRNGDSYMEISQKLGRSEKALRSKIYFVYLTENADKIRAMMGNGAFGDGAPIPTVRQGFNLSRTRTAVRKDLSLLLRALCIRRNELGFEPYWQRFMCMKWDDIAGCTAGCNDCDSCAEFQRIQPQYCARCGGTFFERTENRFCNPCRTARKKAAQRKYARIHAGK